MNYNIMTTFLRIKNPLRRKQRTFYLHKMHVFCRRDASLLHKLQRHALAFLHHRHGSLLFR